MTAGVPMALKKVPGKYDETLWAFSGLRLPSHYVGDVDAAGGFRDRAGEQVGGLSAHLRRQGDHFRCLRDVGRGVSVPTLGAELGTLPYWVTVGASDCRPAGRTEDETFLDVMPVWAASPLHLDPPRLLTNIDRRCSGLIGPYDHCVRTYGWLFKGLRKPVVSRQPQWGHRAPT